jgi:ubiquinone/menaquinone biosynthesis C-methylase UbiE
MADTRNSILIAQAQGCGPALSAGAPRLGDHVLDLGCGEGRELLQAAELVGAKGMVYGLDNNAQSLCEARRVIENSAQANVTLLEASADAVPLPNASLDVVFSNCVLNLITQKDATLAETYRVLKPGGRLAFADIVAIDNKAPNDMLQTAASLIGCKNGVISLSETKAALKSAGFIHINSEIYAAVPFDLIERHARATEQSDALATLKWQSVHDALASVIFTATKSRHNSQQQVC